MVLSRHSLCAGLLLSALLCGAAPTQWSENLVKNGDFTRGSGSVAENWTPGFFDGAKGSVEWRPGSGPDSAAALNFAFTPPPKGLIQAESSLVRLPEQGPRKLRLRVRYRGAGMIQIRFFALNEKREMALLRTAAGTGIKLDRVLEKATDWKSVSTDWMLSPELLSRKLFATAVIMHWPNSSGLSVASLSLQLNVQEPGKAPEPLKAVRINPPPSRVSPPVDRPAPEKPYQFEIDGRTLKKDGKTHYFVGTLCSEWTVNSFRFPTLALHTATFK